MTAEYGEDGSNQPPNLNEAFANLIDHQDGWGELIESSDEDLDTPGGKNPHIAITELVPHIRSAIDALIMISDGAYRHDDYARQLQQHASLAPDKEIDPTDLEDIDNEIVKALARYAAAFLISVDGVDTASIEDDEGRRTRKVKLADIYTRRYGDDSGWLLRLLDYGVDIEPYVSAMDADVLGQYVRMQVGRSAEDVEFSEQTGEHIRCYFDNIVSDDMAKVFPEIFDQEHLRDFVISVGITYGRKVFEDITNRYIFPEAIEFVKVMVANENEMHYDYAKRLSIAGGRSLDELDESLKPFYMGIARLVYCIFCEKYGYQVEVPDEEVSEVDMSEFDTEFEESAYDPYRDFELWHVDKLFGE